MTEQLKSIADVLDAAGRTVRPMSDTAWIDGRDVVLHAYGMVVTARYSAGCWSSETPYAPAEYDGAVWVCFDDKFQFEIEESGRDPSEWHHGPVTGWQDVIPATTIDRDMQTALKPFAALADEWERWQAKGSTSTPGMIRMSYGRCGFGLPEYQAARSALAAALARAEAK